MNRFGFVRVASAIPLVKVADCKYNVQQIESLIAQAEGRGVQIICFPELSISSATCGDLTAQELIITSCEKALFSLLDFTRSLNIVSIIGMPLRINSTLLNTALVIQGGKIQAIIPKDDFETCTTTICGQTIPVNRNLLIRTNNILLGITIGNDITSPVPMINKLAQEGAEIIFNLAAAKELVSSFATTNNLLSAITTQSHCACVYSSCGFGESTSDAVYAGNALIYEDGRLLAQSERFSMKEQLIISDVDIELIRYRRITSESFNAKYSNNLISLPISSMSLDSDDKIIYPIRKNPFITEDGTMEQRCKDILDIQVSGLIKRIVHTNAKSLVIGISGGLDSTLAVLTSVMAMDKLGRDKKDIIAITMPGFGTSNRTHSNAVNLMESLGITVREISIKEACTQHFSDIGHSIDTHDVAYENAQARERTQILMDVANMTNGFVVGTGDLSETALGWCTFNGDHMSNYAVNCSIPKTLMQHVVRWYANNNANELTKQTLLDIVDTPISPELTPADSDGNIKQKTEDIVGPYELHDFFLFHTIRNGFRPAKILYLAKIAFEGDYSDETILHWLKTFCRRFISQQYKRSCSVDGPQVGSVTLGPTHWHMPSDAAYAEWLNDLEE